MEEHRHKSQPNHVSDQQPHPVYLSLQHGRKNKRGNAPLFSNEFSSHRGHKFCPGVQRRSCDINEIRPAAAATTLAARFGVMHSGDTSEWRVQPIRIVMSHNTIRQTKMTSIGLDYKCIASKQRVITTKLGRADDKFGGLPQFTLCKWRQSIYKHKIHQSYNTNFEVYSRVKIYPCRSSSSSKGAVTPTAAEAATDRRRRDLLGARAKPGTNGIKIGLP